MEIDIEALVFEFRVEDGHQKGQGRGDHAEAKFQFGKDGDLRAGKEY